MADNDVSKLRVALSKISEYNKSAAGKQLPVVVRISQDSKKASWKPDKAPNWWPQGQHIDESNIDGVVPQFGPVKSMKIDDIKAALAAFYLARIHFEENVRPSASRQVLEESNDGKNPYSPDHYSAADRQDADEVEEEQADEVDANEAEGSSNSNDEDHLEKEEVVVEEEEERGDEEAKQEDAIVGDIDIEDDGDLLLLDEEYDVKELKRFVSKLKRDEPVSEMFGILRKKLCGVIAAEKARDEWTVYDEEYKLTLGYHTCCAKLLLDVDAMKREEDVRFEAYKNEMMAQYEKDMARLPDYVRQMPSSQVVEQAGPVKSLDDVLARLEARRALLSLEGDESDNDNDDNRANANTSTITNSRRPRTRSSISVADEAGFATPVVTLAQKKRIAAAASRSLKNGTPQRQLKDDEIDYDQDGNAQKISLFTASGSPVLVDASVFQKAARPRRAGRGAKPPPTPATTTATSSRRSKRNKR